ncbi:MAG: phosphoethanolamine transferase [Lentisphaeria bacterium]|nr:phosphoethanolamine transferase [Lentisphaeria bacterium]
MKVNIKNSCDKVFSNLWVYLAVYLVLIAGPDCLPRLFVHHNQAPLEWTAVLSAFAGYVFPAAPLFLLRGRWFRVYAAVLMFFAALGFFVSGYVIMRFHMPVHTGTLDLLSTTSWRESREFLTREILSLSGVYYVLATATGLLIFRFFGFGVKPLPNRKISAVLALCTVLPMAWVFVYYSWIDPDPVQRDSAAWFALLPNQWADSRRKMDVLHECIEHPQIPPDLTCDGKADVAVIVIGESAVRSHLSLYGYDRDTTPELEKNRDELVVFKNVISAMPVTNYSLYYMLTFKTLDDQMHPRATIMSVLDRAGYHIDAYSTQVNFGENSVSALFTQWQPKYHEEEFDECLIEDVREALARREGPTLVILHIMGSHITYRNRYPESFSYFDEEKSDVSGKEINPIFLENINTYDNSIRYTDFILGRIIDELKNVGGKNLLFYFSDHGENVETSFMQNYRDAEKRDSYEVPFLFWFSPEYRASYPDRIAAAESAVDRPIQMDRAAEGILSVFGVSSQGYPASEDFLSPEFAVKPRYMMEGRILYREEDTSSN